MTETERRMVETICAAREAYGSDTEFLNEYLQPMAAKFGDILRLHVEHGTEEFRMPPNWDADRWAAGFMGLIAEVEAEPEPEEDERDDT